MSKKIIIAGAGHGGLTLAAQLAENGYDVTVYERGQKGKLGYDWTDIFDPKALDLVGCPRPEDGKWEWKIDMTFYGGDSKEEKKIRQRVPNDPEQMEIKMERSDIYDLLVKFATDKGAKIEYGVNVKGPIMKGKRVVGIKTDKGDIKGDLVVDCCGMYSPVRMNLPKSLGIQKEPLWGECFHVYRAFYDLAVPYDSVDDKYKVTLFPDKEHVGIAWIATEKDFSDLLIGHMDPISKKEVEDLAEVYRKTNPQLGTKKLRGGQFVDIPVRQALSLMVADGYAALGDSAFMTVPIIGSGIGNAIKNSKILAETIMADEKGEYTAKTLWNYESEYFQKQGRGLAPLAIIKLLLTKISKDQMEYAFNTGILTWRELTITANHTSMWKFLHFDPKLPLRGVALVKDPDLLKKGAQMIVQLIEALALTYVFFPKKYNKVAVRLWSKAYDRVFTKAIGPHN